jgi:hypothetical protein
VCCTFDKATCCCFFTHPSTVCSMTSGAIQQGVPTKVVAITACRRCQITIVTQHALPGFAQCSTQPSG